MEKDENQTGYTLENGNMGQQAISQTNWSANWARRACQKGSV